MTAQHGGEVHIMGSSTVARDQMQVKNFRRTSTSKDTNALHAVMLECKLAQGKADAFVWDVKAAPEPMAVCYTDWQILGLKRFCTDPDEFTVMCADTTYNLGDFCVTPLSYKHLMQEDIRTGKPPVLPGPVLVPNPNSPKEGTRYDLNRVSAVHHTPDTYSQTNIIPLWFKNSFWK